MRQSVLWKGFHVRLSLAVGIALLVSLAIAGCGGGGGSSSGGGTTGPTSLAVVSGTVQDTSGNPVVGATVAIVGTSLTASSGAKGAFTITNVPLNATAFEVTSPSVATYDNTGTYNGVQYTFGTASNACKVPLPTLHASSTGVITLPVIQLDLATNPPAPPVSPVPAGCPGYQSD